MNEMEKVEKLRDRADVSYEDAKIALEHNDWDILDAMIELEKQGKTKAPDVENFSTNYEEQHTYTSVEQTVERSKIDSNDGSVWGKIKSAVKWIWQKGNENYLIMERKGEQIFNLPIWLVIVLLLLAWHILIIALIVSLFFDCHYFIKGDSNLEAVNDVMNKASNVADMAKDEFSKKME